MGQKHLTDPFLHQTLRKKSLNKNFQKNEQLYLESGFTISSDLLLF